MKREDGAGILLTIIFHLMVVIVLLILGLEASGGSSEAFYIDFTREEEEEARQEKEKAEEREEIFKEEVSKSVDELLAAARSSSSNSPRNVRVNGSLKDDRNSAKDVEKLLADAAKVQEELKNKGGISAIEDNPDADKPKDKAAENESQSYSGPSVLRWELPGRKAYSLPIPAYRCYGEGLVVVFISVNRQGKVVEAKVDKDSSSSDPCLTNFAVKAARQSRFNPSDNAAERQAGSITYSFIAQ